MSGGSGVKIFALTGGLLEWQIDFVLRRLRPTRLFDILDHTDHGQPSRRLRSVAWITKRQTFADGVFRRPLEPGQSLVDDYDSGRLRGVAFGELAPGTERNADGPEVTGAAHT